MSSSFFSLFLLSPLYCCQNHLVEEDIIQAILREEVDEFSDPRREKGTSTDRRMPEVLTEVP